jgi:restriction system protein
MEQTFRKVLCIETLEQSTPEESIENAYAQIRSALGSEILAKVKSCSPAFFERLVIDLLVRMGYGGSRSDAGRAVGKSGDGGIDGIINEDRLGLDVVYIQAKRWDGTVGRPEIQKFGGALQGHRARKGVFITTSSFTREAEEYVSRVDSKIILIGGEQLAELMMDFGVGVTNQAIYEIKRVDSDYFTEE